MLSSVIGALSVVIGGDTGPLGKSLKSGEKDLASFEKSVSSVHSSITGLFKLMLAAAPVIMFKHFTDGAEEVGKAAQKVGVLTEELSALKYAAHLNDVTFEQLTQGLRFLSKNIVEARGSAGEMRDAFLALGFSNSDLQNKSLQTEESLLRIADKFEGMKDGAGKTAIAIKIFGKAGAELIPFLNQGRDGIEALKLEAHRLGVVISGETAKQAEEFNDNIKRIKAASEGTANAIMKDLLPAFVRLSEEMVQGTRIAGSTWRAMLLFGTINPFRSVGGNIKEITGHLEDLEAGLKKRKDRGWDTSGWEEKIRDTKKQLEFLKFQQQQEALSNTGPDTKDARDLGAHSKAKKKEKKDAPDLTDWRKANAEWLHDNEQLSKGMEEEDQVRVEAQKIAADAEVEQRQKALERIKVLNALDMQETDTLSAYEIAVLKDQYDQRNQILMDAADAEQAQAIERGAAILAADGDSYSMRMEALRQSLLTSEQMEEEQYQLRRARIAAEIDDEATRNDVLEKMDQQHQDRMAGIRKGGNEKIYRMINAMREGDLLSATDYLAQLTAGFTQHSRSMFELNKAAGIANAILNAYIGISKSLAAYPFPWNIAAAAAHAIIAFQQVAAIKATTFGSGSAAPSLAGTTAATPVQDVGASQPRTQQITNVSLHGDVFDRNAVRGLLTQIADDTRDGGRVVFAG